MKKSFDYYDVKIIETPTSIEVWEYLEKPVFFIKKHDIDKDKNKNNNLDELLKIDDKNKTALEEYDSIKRKQKHYESMRWHIARIVDCNFDNNTKFMTLTFKENIQDIEYTNYEFNKFIKRLNFNLYKTKKQQLKYLAVWEQQKRGAIHYHIIFFDLPYIKIKDLEKIWGNGFVKLNKIDVDSKDNRGRYVSKYFSKDIDIKTYKQKSFFKSQNLKAPTEKLIKSIDGFDFSDYNVVFSKEYTRKSPEFNSKDLENYMTFAESTVRYSKIRKEI